MNRQLVSGSGFFAALLVTAAMIVHGATGSGRFLTCAAAAAEAGTGRSRVVRVRRIWADAPHNAFTDLIRHNAHWYCVFREGQRHVSPDGTIRVIRSPDGESWSSVGRLTSRTADLRDPKITTTPNGGLMLTAAAALHQPAEARHQTLAWFSSDGLDWGRPIKIGEPDYWLWRVTWHKNRAFGVGYHTAGKRDTRLYTSDDGRNFDVLRQTLFNKGDPSEASLVFLPDETAHCLLRRDGGESSAQLGQAMPPYTDWKWRDLGVRVGGPNMIRLPDGRLLAAVRLYDGRTRTALCWIDPEAARLTEFLTLPSGGDTSYAGLVFHDGHLWMSYYSSHEQKASIYLARIRLPAE